MDSLGQNPEHPESHSIGQAYPFDSFQNDSFNSIFTGDHDHSFQTAWQSDAIQDHQAQPDAFRQGTHGWHQNTLPTSNALQQSGYGMPPREFATSYSQNPTSFNYPAFDPHPSHAFSAPAYDPALSSALSYTPDLLVNGSAFRAPRQSDYLRTSSPGQTISPQALQGFPTAYEQPSTPREYQSQQLRTDPNVSSKGSSAGQRPAQVPAARGQGRAAVAAAVPAGTVQGIFVIKPSAQLSSATDSTEFKPFVFVGNSAIEVDAAKATLPKYNQRRCKNEVRRLLLREKGDGPWSAGREPLLKKLKISVTKSARPRSAGISTAQRGTPGVEYESSADSSSESESEEDSDYYSGSEEDMEPEEPPPLAPSRPDDPVEATKYDIVKAVWAKRSSNLTGPVIRAALGDYWNVIKAIRDSWKTETTALQQAEETKDQSKIKNRQRRAAEQRQIMESAIGLTLKHGHRDIVAKLGENALLFLVFYQFIADRFKEGDYSGSLIASILELMTRCITLDQAVLEKTKVDKVLGRITKKGSDRVKALAQKVLDNAAANNTQRSNDTKPALSQGVKEKAGVKVQLPASRAVDAVVGMKRQRESESAAVQPAKKINGSAATTSSVSAPTKNLGSTGKRTQLSKTDAKAAPPSTSSTPAPKPKANHIVAKPSGFFSSLQSASKKPGTSNAALQSAQQKDGKKGTVSETSAPSSSTTTAAVPKPAFSFAETMANLTKPKETAPAPKSDEDRPSETAEERTKRLRKEERRKLRVSFRPDDSLVEIRTFVHEPEEETGHEDSMVRDVDDIGSEGRMLKMHKDLDDIDDEEDNAPGEETFSPWRTPSVVDFSVIEADELARNCSTRGGNMEVKSHERAVQEQRELTTLMVIYTSSSDIPPSPREPSNPYSGEPVEERMFGSPPEETKTREAMYYAERNLQLRPLNGTATGQPQTPDIASLLKILNGQQQQQQPPPPPPQQPAAATSTNGLEAIFARFAGNQTAPLQNQVPQPQQQLGFSGFDLQATLAAMSQQNQPRSGYAAPPTSQTPDLQAILSQIGQQPAAQGYGYANQYQVDNDRKRQLEYDSQANDYGYTEGKRQKSGKHKDKKYIPRVPCKFWQEGKCKKGDDCNFLHT